MEFAILSSKRITVVEDTSYKNVKMGSNELNQNATIDAINLEYEDKKLDVHITQLTLANEKQHLINEIMRKKNEYAKTELYSATLNLIRVKSVKVIERERFNAIKEKVGVQNLERNDEFKEGNLQAKNDPHEISRLQKLSDEKSQLDCRISERKQHLEYLKNKKTELLISKNHLNAKLRRMTNVMKTQVDKRRMNEQNLADLKEKLNQIQIKK